ncbi:hypothetical protein AB0B04_18730 [Streptomyces xinghaiensis]|uniref:Uncharacterized protein n=2 Tax=Streptomyces TaxID=1883 RepID=A0A3R7HAJ8_9ACTN|nr:MULTISPECIES: hypothetical protein [Streptomyces]KNE81407.1 hypothetical protein ADZ36_16660 [Streptomyces fradiae]OFA48250.1 hypothetical protein BEN35_19105 [Streptomyces fradiae]PQM20681.1 hypothetical protein Sfr7A_26210 [Streptomyces xinghaiensis]RKM92621.1 hypothetical protein SFRA_024860 [Streptomyces xinghaiensis]RNC70589.1 hypothetical protein DC095_025850 [Streptomyces xinghaiensis]
MPDTDATRQKETKGQGDALEPDPPTPRLYSLTTRYIDQFLGGQDGPDLLSDDAITALHFALTVSSSSPLAITCSVTADGRTWTRLPLHVLRADAVNALRQDVKPPMLNDPPSRPRAALSRLIEHAQRNWLDSVLREPVDDVSTWVPDEPAAADWIRAGRLWAAIWGEPPSESVLDQLPFPTGTPSTTLGRISLRTEATAVLDAIALAHTPATDDSLADLHAAWKLLHDLDETLDPQYGPGTDLRTPVHLLLDRIAALHPDTAAPLAATRDHPGAARIRAAAHAYLRHVLALWPDTADWTDRARTAYLEELHALRLAKGGQPAGPPETQAQTVLRAVLAPLAEPTALSRHEAAALWRSHSGRGAEQASWDTTVQTNRMDDLARAHTTEGTPRQRGEAIAAAQRNLTAATHYHDEHLTTHAARGHLHRLAASLVTLDKARRALQEGIWQIADARRAQHDPAKGPWNGYDEHRATADLTPVLTAGEARIAHLRQRHLDATHEALTDLIPQLTDIPRDGHRHYAMRTHLAPLDLLRQDLNTLASLIDTRRRTCTELRTRLDTGPRFGQKHAITHDLAAAEKDLRGLERRYADTQTEFALSVTIGRTFDQVRNPPPPDATAAQHSADAAPRPTRRTIPSTPTGHDQATAAALRPGPTAHGRTAGA